MKCGKATDAKSVYVFSEIDGFRYKLVMEGDIGLLTVAKIKRYLQNATGLSCQQQEILFNDRVLRDDECGGDVGFADGTFLRMRHVNAARNAKRSSVTGPRCRSQSMNDAGRCGVMSAAVKSFELRPSTNGVPTPRQGSNERCFCDSTDEIARGSLASSAKQTECDRRLRGEVEELRSTVARLTMEKNDAERLAREKWMGKVGELVKELDVLREERRKLHNERALAEQEQRAVVCALEQQIKSQQKELLGLKEAQEVLAQRSCCRCTKTSVVEKVASSLKQLSVELDIPCLQLDDSDTCVLPLENATNILFTLDTATERLFMYAVIANSLPSSAEHRLRLFETLLEGALLGREMAGGGVGVCLRNDLVIMDICFNMAHVDEYALASVARQFIASVQHWIAVVRDIMTFPES